MGQKLPDRISPTLLSRAPSYFSDSINTRDYILEMPSGFALSWRDVIAKPVGRDIWILRVPPASVKELISSGIPFRYIDELARPVPESGVLSYDMAVNRINKIWDEYPSLQGQGQVVSVKENRMDSADIDLLKRYLPSPNASATGETHATVMTTLIAGAGLSSYKGRGVAPEAFYSSSDFFSVLPDEASYYSGNGIEVQNHSYGAGIQNFYGINARAFDNSVNENERLLHVFSAGNSGTAGPAQGLYAPVRGYANITGNMKMAKNVFLVGAMDQRGNVPAASSKGPLYDGRIAPHVVAFGEDGSSGAAALASGVSLLMQQRYKQIHGLPASSAILRAALINSADDIGNKGPDYASGFGRMNGYEALKTIEEDRILQGSLASGDLKEFVIDVPGGIRELKFTLTWTDPAADAGAPKGMINDLDIELVAPGGELLLPWVLSIFPHPDSLSKAAARKADTLNVVEQITVDDPLPGQYIVRVRARQLVTASQDFYVAYNVSIDNEFSWDFPQANDVLVSGSNVILQWHGGSGLRGVLEQSRNGGTWELVSGDVNLADGSYSVQLDNNAYELSFRMQAGADIYTSSTALVAPDLVTEFAFVCDSTILNYWDKVTAASGYRLYRLNDDSMKLVAATEDTSVLVSRPGSEYFAVSSVINGRESFRGPASSYIFRRVGCYIDNFLADLLPDNTVRLSLELGTDFQVARIDFRKPSAGNRLVTTVALPSAGTITVFDENLQQGVNIYEVEVYLSDGRVIRSSRETVYYLGGKAHVLYPNPVMRGQDIFLLTDDPDEQMVFVYDNNGKILVHEVVVERNQRISTRNLPAGMYHLRVVSAGGSEHHRFIVL